MQHIKKNNSHGSLIGSTSIFEFEQHDNVMEIAHRCPESNRFTIEWVHLNVIIATEIIHKGDQ